MNKSLKRMWSHRWMYRLVLFISFSLALPSLSFSQVPFSPASVPVHHEPTDRPDSVSEVKAIEEKIYRPILNTDEHGFDTWFSPHLRDSAVDAQSRNTHAYRRAEAGVGPAELASIGQCYGGCGECDWDGPDRPQVCCGVQTESYANLIEDSNFKTCCVRTGEEALSEEEIACRHPSGDGWAGLFEYYYPVNAIGWESEQHTSLIAAKETIQQCVKETDLMMTGSEWLERAVENRSASNDPSRPNTSTKFSEINHGGGALTEAIHLAALDPAKRRQIARHFCMHEDQFMKLLDPEEDPLQKGGGVSADDLARNIPLWANYCPTGVKLLTDSAQSYLIENLDETPTDLFQGMLMYHRNKNFCSTDPTAAQRQGSIQRASGFSCSAHSPRSPLVPLQLLPSQERPLSLRDRIEQFIIAGGYTKGEMASEGRRYYKPYEPQSYTGLLRLFSGHRFEGSGYNELGQRCDVYEGDSYRGTSQADKLFESSYGDPAHRRYWASFRAFATCPRGYRPWKGPHNEGRVCGEEYFGGKRAGL